MRLRRTVRGERLADAMSVITVERIERRAAPDKPAPEVMSRSIALSAALHLGIVVVVLFGLPSLFRPPPPTETPIAVELVTLAPHTRATYPNRFRPLPKAKPEPAKAPPAPVPPPKPQPPEAAAAPPPSASAPPAREPPPAPPKPAAKAVPPPPPKPLMAERPPVPPAPPEPKPRPEPRSAHPAPPPASAKVATAAFAKLLDHLDQKGPQPAAFDTLLKNLTREEATRQADAPPKPQRIAAAAPSSQPQAPLDEALTASQIDLIIRKIEGCWDVPAGARDAKNLDIEIKAALNPDGTVRQAVIVDTGRYAGDPFFRAAADSAKRALLDPRCSPLPVPPDKYEAWHNLDLFFNPKDLL
jgi:hypothetical protein